MGLFETSNNRATNIQKGGRMALGHTCEGPEANDIEQGDGIEAIQIGSFPNKIYPKTKALTNT